MNHLFLIDDCETFYISAENEGQALRVFAEYHGFDSIEQFIEDMYGSDDTIEAIQVDDDKVFEFGADEDSSRTESMTAKEWAAETVGLVASTVY